MDFIKELGELALGSRLRRIIEILRRDIKALYRSQNIDFEPFLMPALNLLSRKKHLQITQIAQMLDVSQPAATQFCKSLNESGLITILNNTSDQRKREVNITDKGIDLVNKLKPVWDEIEIVAREIVKQSDHNLMVALDDFESEIKSRDIKSRVIDRLKTRDHESVTIVKYSEKLKPFFKSLNLEWLKKSFSVEPIDEEVLSRPEEIIKKGGCIFFAKVGEEVVGSVALLKKNNEMFELSKMAVTEKFQGRGIGRKLMESCIRKAKERGVKQLFLYSNTCLPKAINLYFTSGFRVAPLDENPYKRTNIKMEMTIS